MNVYWLLAARERLRAELHGQLTGLAVWLPRLNSVLAEVFAGQVVLVRDRYSGYRPFDGLVILFVEVQPGPDSSRSASPPCFEHGKGRARQGVGTARVSARNTSGDGAQISWAKPGSRL